MPSPLRALSLLPCLAAPLAAQAVEGIALADGAPVGYALVFLVDSAGGEVGSTLSDAAGRFTVRAPAPGSHRVAVRRIGQRSWLSEPLVLGAAVQPLALDLPDQPVSLPDLRPEATGRCRVRPALGAATEALLEAARTGLGVAEIVTRRGLVHARAEVWVRVLDTALAVQAERSRPVEGPLEWPFLTVPPEQAAAEGFVAPGNGNGQVLAGPDSRMLGADWFLDTHCFDLALPEPPGDSIVGVAFRPDAPATRPDLHGTLWLDRRSLRPLRLEFRWTGLDPVIPRDVAGAELDFLPAAGGGLVLGGWWVRTPLLDEFGPARRIAGYVDDEGEVTEVLGAPPAP